jgi:hypothetical protein
MAQEAKYLLRRTPSDILLIVFRVIYAGEIWERAGEHGGLTFVLSLRKTYRRGALFPFAALFKEFYAFEAFEDGTFAAYGGCGFERVVLGHLESVVRRLGRTS